MVKLKPVLEPNDLHIWRRDRRLRQAQLAEMLGRSRETIIRWEAGKTSIPDWVSVKLEELTHTLAPKAVPKLPDFVTHDSAPHLYGKGKNGGWFWLPDHPGMVVHRKLFDPHTVCDPQFDQFGMWIKIPFAVLENEDYKRAAALSVAMGTVGGQ